MGTVGGKVWCDRIRQMYVGGPEQTGKRMRLDFEYTRLGRKGAV